MKDYIGGVILFDETIKQKTTLGPTIPELISKHGAIPGIKVDKGAKPLAGSGEETVTEGLDGLREIKGILWSRRKVYQMESSI